MKHTNALQKMLSTAAVMGAMTACAALAQTPAAPATPAPPPPEHTFTANVALYSQYIFRGLTQTDRRPAIQGGFDYSHASGFYAGLWGSNISWISDFNPGVSASLELDTYLGYKNNITDDIGYDVGYLRYNYPGNYHGVTKADTDELYGALSWKWITAKYSHSVGDKTFGVANSRNTYYADLTAAVPLPSDLTLTLHVGRQKYKGSIDGVSNNALSYTDWKVELAWAFAKDWSAGAGYTDTNARRDVYTPASTGRFIGDSQGYAFLKKTF